MPLDLFKKLSQYIIPKHSLTLLAGYLADVKNIKVKDYLIQRFIHEYQVNMSEALIENPEAYQCFNDFFIRRLKPGCRPLAQAGVISPVDGCVSEIGSIEEDRLIQAKGHYYTVSELLACNKEIASRFINGRFATLYLSPKDYHRVHMPIDAEITSMTYIPGALFSVQPSTVQVVPKLFARNERLAIFFSTPVGPMAIVMVGATIVGAIGTSWHGDIKRSKNRVDFEYPQANKKMAQGDEMGYFKLGSTVVVLFADESNVDWNKELKAGSVLRFGEAMGEIGDNKT
ncbi:archaetidylserine decarboxylase [Legionella longbeachae]|uniref:Phosphatidylserine decarboxylase proenzyme n=1 Tax=Legionella longbeachae serogroup 1 (strain NSW150) TaxID=661367 RepID=D3HN18_LEGLN|nr:archaetidylserine decarboxylase [Legionella longbeachae]VEE04384.1 phosphatidylserine decarboxylase [Legionella oakridgensis]HBD7397136.1 phosphatidylserine decarboxylase [Legionella pneumophila]ARB92796.1 phosphatidylserine decarboxylase [Legionella longbeachae]ARM34039.1 phosphatidylserine decarboxylase [Legionella longbeachae]EEZ96735.1 phosphatidylserine decarboxylase [Legionella longbeachae D-4968]